MESSNRAFRYILELEKGKKDMKLTKSQISKIILVLVIAIICNFAFPIYSNAGFFSGILTRPICFLVVSLTDSINMMLNGMLMPVIEYNDENGESKSVAIEEIKEALDKSEEGGLLNKVAQARNSFLMSPDKIFNGDAKLLDANIFTANTYDDNNSLEKLFLGSLSGDSIASALKKSVSNIYIILRNISAVILLCLLIYTGIRILLMSASPYDQAKWKNALIDWVKALCLLVFMHLLMVGIFYISDLIVDSLSQTMGGTNITTMIRNAYANNNFWDDSEAIITTIMYVYITYLTVVFAIAYFKRLIWTVVLIVISPIVAVTKALGQKQGQIFDQWLKEFIYNVLLQPFHMLIFFILVGIPLGMLGNSVDRVDLISRFAFEPTNYGVYIYILISISLIRPAEKFLYKLFGFNSVSVAKQGTSESGVKTIKSVENVVKQTVSLATTAVAAAATGGAAAAARGAAGGGMPPLDGPGGLGLSGPNGPELPSGPSGPELPAEPNGPEGPELPAKPNGPDGPELPGGADSYGLDRPDRLNEFYLSERDMDNNQLRTDNFSLDRAFVFTNGANIEEANVLGLNNISSDKTEDDPGANSKIELHGDAEFDVSDAEFDNMIGQNKPKNRLMDRLENNPYLKAAGNYFTSPDSKEKMNELKAGVNELRDTMYLDGDASEEWKGTHETMKEKIKAEKIESLNAVVNNKNNIGYMMREHGLDEKEAKSRLEKAAPYLNSGIMDVATLDKLISSGQKEGTTPSRTMLHVAGIENVINDQSKISAVAQIIANKTGENPRSSRVKTEAKSTMEQARPYVEAGQKDPEVLHRLVQLENNLKSAKIAKGIRTPDKVIKMDKIIDKAMKDGLKKVNITEGKESSEGMKQLEKAMNKELRDRKGISAPKNDKSESKK